jgi:hypothetical protein
LSGYSDDVELHYYHEEMLMYQEINPEKIKGIQMGQTELFNDIIICYQFELYSNLRDRLKISHMAESITSATLQTAATRICEYTFSIPFSAWLMQLSESLIQQYHLDDIAEQIEVTRTTIVGHIGSFI